MSPPLFQRMVWVVIAAGLNACSGEGLTLPRDEGPTAPAALTAFAGNGQEGIAGRRLEEPLVVLVTGSDSRPLAGVAIVFQFQNDVPGAEIDPAEDETNEQGLASAGSSARC